MRLQRKLVSILAGGMMLSASPLVLAEQQSLVNIFELAEQHDPQLRAAEQARLATLEARPQARSQLLPQVNAQGTIDRVDQNNEKGFITEDQNYTQTNLGINVKHPLFYKDREIQLDQANKQVQQAAFDYAAAEQDLIIRTAEAYFNVLKARADLEFAQANKKAISRQLEQTRKRFEVGLTAITDVHEAKARYDQAVAQEITSRNQLDNAFEALATITGRSHEELADLRNQLELAPPEPQNHEAWVNKALEENLQTRSQRIATDIARQEIEKQRAAHYPSVDLKGSYSYDESGAFGTDSETGTASVGVQVSMPIYTGGAISSRKREAVYSFQQAQENLEGTVRQTRQQTRDAYRGVMSSISEVRALKQALTSAETALEATEAGFEVGTRTIVDVLDSQRALFEAQRDYATARYDYILNTLRLKQAAGTLSAADVEQVDQHLR